MKQPVLSPRERDRRWGLTRNLVKQNQLDCLIVTPGNPYYSPDRFDAWLTNDDANGTVIFPLKGDPCYLVWSAMHGTFRMLENKRRGIAPWMEDYRVFRPPSKEGIAPVLKEKGLESARIGIVTLMQQGPGSGGGIAYLDWVSVLQQLPQANFVDVTQQFAEIILAKSEEELELVRYAAYVGNKTCEAMLKEVRPGVSETEIYATIMSTIFQSSANSHQVILHTGVENLSWGPPMWTCQAQIAPVVGKGDLVLAEIFPIYGGLESQQQMAVATRPVDAQTQELANVARKSYEAGIKVMRPGMTFGEVYDAMKKPLNEAGCWHLTPLTHTMNPIIHGSGTLSSLDQIQDYKSCEGVREMPMKQSARDYVLKPGVLFELEPNACRGRRRVNIGGTVLITKDGVEELNKFSAEMRVAA